MTFSELRVACVVSIIIGTPSVADCLSCHSRSDEIRSPTLAGTPDPRGEDRPSMDDREAHRRTMLAERDAGAVGLSDAGQRRVDEDHGLSVVSSSMSGCSCVGGSCMCSTNRRTQCRIECRRFGENERVIDLCIRSCLRSAAQHDN